MSLNPKRPLGSARLSGIGTTVLAFVLLALTPSSLTAADRYVDGANPNCPGTGTILDPFCTVQAAIAAATDGDIVHVAAGNYTTGVVMIDKHLSIVGSPGTIVNGWFDVGGFFGGGDFNADIVDLEFNGTLHMHSGGTLTISNSTITSHDADAVSTQYGTTLIADCVIVATGTGHAVLNEAWSVNDTVPIFESIGHANTKIDNSRIASQNDAALFNHGHAESSFGYPATSTAVVKITNSTIVGSNIGIRHTRSGNATVYAVTELVQSTVTGGAKGIVTVSSIGNGVSYASIANSIVAGNVQDLSGTVSSSGYNCIGNTSGGTLVGIPTGNLLGVDPLFVDPSNGNFRLQPMSPCIDAGSNQLANGIPTDLDGHGRFLDDPATVDTGIGSAPIVDIGPYEFCGHSYGNSCAGVGGFVPELLVTGGCPPVAGNAITVTIQNGFGGATVLFCVGSAQRSTPIAGSCALLVSPILSVVAATLPGVGPGNGAVSFPVVIPASAAGAVGTIQAWVVDGSNGIGGAASNGIQVSVAP